MDVSDFHAEEQNTSHPNADALKGAFSDIYSAQETQFITRG